MYIYIIHINIILSIAVSTNNFNLNNKINSKNSFYFLL